ncbi:unnamed protein product [Tilletia laevis]|uniref:Uncharacterized protein n=2 Tax=Tilletia TaxID=13289 RepID=A0A177UX97_9BASI|nr:hypothetical protein CF336_g4109 [Tilletia laevis]KAE8261308.1 hypothetical protein A4X03_0g3371 [Tilletia caries]CAD6983098.1 unnamed protein product [Tilletia controversa]CAD6887237.1 unnamed protein product [Tilletia caries]CAD6901886.1 unnamed protein product [Tilletia caries]
MRFTFLTFVFVVSLFVGIVQAYNEEWHQKCEAVANGICTKDAKAWAKNLQNCLCWYWTSNGHSDCVQGCLDDYKGLYNNDTDKVKRKCQYSCSEFGPDGCSRFQHVC